MTATPSRRGSRASEPGSPISPRSRPGRRRLAACGVLAGLAAAAIIVLTYSSGSAPAARYGSLPSWLPTLAVPVGRVVQASAAHPWLAIEGDAVRVHLARGQVLATAVGPAVPEEGKFPVPATTPCTFTVTFTSASGTVPLSPAAFTIRDELGQLHHPRVTAQDGKSPPGSAMSGRPVTLTITAVLPTGNGQLQWAPQGGRPIVSWDFDVEID